VGATVNIPLPEDWERELSGLRDLIARTRHDVIAGHASVDDRQGLIDLLRAVPFPASLDVEWLSFILSRGPEKAAEALSRPKSARPKLRVRPLQRRKKICELLVEELLDRMGGDLVVSGVEMHWISCLLPTLCERGQLPEEALMTQLREALHRSFDVLWSWDRLPPKMRRSAFDVVACLSCYYYDPNLVARELTMWQRWWVGVEVRGSLAGEFIERYRALN
jgi:hypothetical protein